MYDGQGETLVSTLRRTLLELRVETRQPAASSDGLETFSRQNIDVADIVIESHIATANMPLQALRTVSKAQVSCYVSNTHIQPATDL
jgi:hypothetical protein